LNLDGAAYTVNGTQGYTGTVGLLGMAKGQELVVTRSLNFGDNDGDGWNAQWPTFAASHGWDNFSTLFSGRFSPPVSGNYAFEWHNDDRGMAYIDLNHDGVFSANERMGNIDWNHNNDGSYAFSLTAGQSYNVVMMAHDWGGGEGFHFTLNGPAGVGNQIMDPSNAAQAGYWQHLEGAGSKAYGNNVSVSASSTVGVNSNGNADLGTLAMTRGTTLTLEGGVGFTSTSFNGPAGNAIFNTSVAGTTSKLGQIADTGTTTVLIKRGLGELVINPTPAASIGHTSFQVDEGTLTGSANADLTTSLGGRPVVLNGGKLKLGAGNAVPTATRYYTFDDAAHVTRDSITGTDGTLVNGATYTSVGYTGGALDLSTNRSAYLSTLPNGAQGVGVAMGGTWTLSAWFQGLDTTADWRTLARGWNNDHHVIIQNDGQLGDYQNGFHTTGYNVAPLIGTTAWHQIVAVGSGGSTTMYIDNVMVGTAASEVVQDIFAIGNYQGNAQRFANYLDNVGLWSGTALTASQITALYTSGQAAMLPTSLNFGSTVRVNTSSEIESSYSSNLGALTLVNGATLTVTPNGTTTRFPSTTVDPAAPGNVAVGMAVNAGTAYPGIYTQAPAGTTTFTKSGPGYLMFEFSDQNVSDASTFQIQNGWLGMQADGSGTHALDGASYVLNDAAGGLIISATDPSTTVALENPITITGAGGSIEARAYNATDTSGAVFVTRTGALTIGAGSDLTLRPEGNYTITLSSLTGPGNLIKTGGSTATITWPTGTGYQGNTTVHAGTLVVNGVVNQPNTSSILVDGGTLQVKNTMTTGNVTVTGGLFTDTANKNITLGTLLVTAPGTFLYAPTSGAWSASLAGLDSLGTTTFNHDLTIRTGGRIQVDAGTTTAAANVTTPEILITGGDYVQASRDGAGQGQGRPDQGTGRGQDGQGSRRHCRHQEQGDGDGTGQGQGRRGQGRHG
jgi:hypothetical protein